MKSLFHFRSFFWQECSLKLVIVGAQTVSIDSIFKLILVIVWDFINYMLYIFGLIFLCVCGLSDVWGYYNILKVSHSRGEGSQGGSRHLSRVKFVWENILDPLKLKNARENVSRHSPEKLAPPLLFDYKFTFAKWTKNQSFLFLHNILCIHKK